MVIQINFGSDAVSFQHLLSYNIKMSVFFLWFSFHMSLSDTAQCQAEYSVFVYPD